MIFEKASKEELIQIILSWMNATKNPIFIVDRNDKVVTANAAFENFSQKQKQEILGVDFGNALGCRYLDKDNKQCGLNYFCELCKFREAIKSNISGIPKESTGSFVRDFNLDNEIIFRHINFQSFQIELAGSPFVVVVINQSEMDLNPNNTEQ